MELRASCGVVYDTEDTVAHLLVQRGKFGELRDLLRSGSVVDARNLHQETLLHHACREGRVDMITLLGEFHANVEAEDSEGDTPLHWCARHNKRGAASALLLLGASKTSKNQRKQTAFHLAMDQNSFEVAPVLQHRPISLLRRAIDRVTPRAPSRPTPVP